MTAVSSSVRHQSRAHRSSSTSRVGWQRAARCGAALFVVALGLGMPRVGEAQAFNYPSMQLPTASVRDYTAALSGGGGSTALFQWRERLSEGMHIGLDAGLADPQGKDNLMLFVGGSAGRELLRATADQPLDLLGTAGVGVAFGNGGSYVRVPFGVSAGHTFGLDGGLSVTPYVHPRLSVDICTRCRGVKNSALTLDFDLGANLQINREFAVRVAGVFSGSDQYSGGNAFAVGLNWTPASLAKPTTPASRAAAR